MRPFIDGQSFFNLIQTAIPGFVAAEYPLFIEFVTAYLRFLEQARTFTTVDIRPEYGTTTNSTEQVTDQLGGPLYEARKLLDYRDADSSLDEFKTHFLSMFGKNFPDFSYVPTGLLVQSLRQFYQSKGTVESIQWLFRSLFNEYATVYFPRTDIIRASDGTWSAPLTLKVSAALNGRNNNDVAKFYVGQRVQTTTGSAQVEAVITNVVGQAYNQNIVVNELVLKFGSILGTFTPGQDLVNLDSAEMVHTIILPVVTGLIVDTGGSNYAVGDVVTLSEGPSGGYGYGAFGTVSIVSNTAINGITVLSGGDGFLVGQPVTFISTSGSGASAIVNEVVYGNFLLEDGTGYLQVEQQTPGVTNYLTLEDQNMLLLELLIDSFVNATSNVLINDPDYGVDSGVPQLDGVVIDSEIDIALAAIDEKPFMDPWVFTNALETTATLANAAANMVFVSSSAFFANGAEVFSLVNLQDAVSNTSTANVTANVIVAQITEGGETGTLYLKNFTGLNKFSTGMVLKSAGTGVLQNGTVTTNGTSNVVGSNTKFFEDLSPNDHLRYADGTQVVVRQIVNNTFLITYGAAPASLVANTYSVIPVGTVSSITPQAQRFYGKIKSIQLLTNGSRYTTPPAVTVDSVSARAQQLFHLNPDPISPVNTTSSNNSIVASADQIHVFSPASLAVEQAAGQIQAVKIINSGVNYQDANATVATATHGAPRTGENAEFTVVTGALTQQPGQYTTTRGFPSADKFLQNSTFYNDYTYVVRVAESFDRYKNILLQLTHPAGFNLLGRFVDTIASPITLPVGSMTLRYDISDSGALTSHGAIVKVKTP